MRYIFEPHQLTIRLEGAEQVWALKRRIQIPHYAISDISFTEQEPTLQDFYGYLRLPGTTLPWRFLAGSYRRHGKREFWYVKLRQTGILTIAIKQDTLNYDRIRITCSHDVAEEMLEWWQAHK